MHENKKTVSGFDPAFITMRSRHNDGGSVTKTLNTEPKCSTESITLNLHAPSGTEIMYNEVICVPSHKNPANIYSMSSCYRMADLMLTGEYGNYPLRAIAKEMGITGEFNCSGPRKNLKNSNLYHLCFMLPHKIFKAEEVIPFFLEHVSEMLRMLTRDPQPVIVVSPELLSNKSDHSEVMSVESLTQLLLDAGFQPVRKNSQWYYLSK